MSELEFRERLKSELAKLGLTVSEDLSMIGKLYVGVAVFGDPENNPSASLTYGFVSDRKRLIYPVHPDQAALRIYEYIHRYKKTELAKEPVGKKPSEVLDHKEDSNWWDRFKTKSKKSPGKKQDSVDVSEPVRRVFAMPASQVVTNAKSIEEFQLADFTEGQWVLTANGEMKLAEKLEVFDLPPAQVQQLRMLSRKLKELEAKIA
jgi:hypothetical protein